MAIRWPWKERFLWNPGRDRRDWWGLWSNEHSTCRPHSHREQLWLLPLLCHSPPGQGPGLGSLGAVHVLRVFSRLLAAMGLCLLDSWELGPHSTPSHMPLVSSQQLKLQPRHITTTSWCFRRPHRRCCGVQASDHDTIPFCEISYSAPWSHAARCGGREELGDAHYEG